MSEIEQQAHDACRELEAATAACDRFPDLLAAARRAHASLKDLVADGERVLADRENETALLVQGETKEDGKPAFTNEGQRKIETKRRLAQDSEYQRFAVSQSTLRRDATNAGIALNRLEDQRRSTEVAVQVAMKKADIIIALLERKHVDLILAKLKQGGIVA